MSEEAGGEKSFDATPSKLEEARRKGDVAKSMDLPQFASLAGAAGVLIVGGGWMARNIAQGLTPFVAHPEAISLDGGGAVEVLRQAALTALPPIMLVMGAAALLGAGGNLIQHGFLWTGEKLKPDMSKVSPGKGFKRIFGIDGFVQFLKSMLKIAVMAAIAWAVLRPSAGSWAELSALQPEAVLPLVANALTALVLACAGALGVAALADWIWQRHRFMQRMRMSREELKQDYRQSEGDPHVKAKLRQIRIEKSRRRMMQAVPKATVVVTNPTHFAVALRYEAGETAAPQCVAKGADAIALKIREVAEAAGVPVIEDPPLARALFAAVDIDQSIPRQHFEAVAKVIGFVLSGRRGRIR
ncbi:MAG: flagellar biosynthesis protein FlhB [Caulobacteraceae bacterium]